MDQFETYTLSGQAVPGHGLCENSSFPLSPRFREDDGE